MRRRRLLLLVVSTVVLATLTAVVLMVRHGNSAPAVPVVRPYPTPVQSAKAAHSRLTDWVDSWAEDAEIITASISLMRGQADDAPWSFLIYSRKNKRVAVVTIAGSELIILRERRIAYPQTGIALDQWTLDSEGALDRWWQRGGEMAWEKSGGQSLHMRLSMKSDTLVWHITVLDAAGETVGFWSMRADSGDSLPD